MQTIKPSPWEYAEYYGKYINRVPDGNIVTILSSDIHTTVALLRPLTDVVASSRYADGKWSVKEVAGHLIDCERVYNYRALRFSRKDAIPLPGFDENAYAAHGIYQERSIQDILDEFVHLRRTTVDFFNHLAPEMWSRGGTANEHPCTVRAVAWILAGHEMHHRAIIQERYLG